MCVRIIAPVELPIDEIDTAAAIRRPGTCRYSSKAFRRCLQKTDSVSIIEIIARRMELMCVFEGIRARKRMKLRRVLTNLDHIFLHHLNAVR